MRSAIENILNKSVHKLKNKACKRDNTPGQAHALTFTCSQGRPFLSRDRSRQRLVDAIAEARTRLAFHVWAYVIMPEHVHLLVLPTEPTYSISDALQEIKRPVARLAVSYLRRCAPQSLRVMRDVQPNGKVAYRSWQRGGGYDRNLESPKVIRSTIDYIHANPVRRGLAELPEKWKWSSAGYYFDGRPVPLTPDVATVPGWDESRKQEHGGAALGHATQN